MASLSEALWRDFMARQVFVLGFNPGAAASGFHTAAGATGTGAPFPPAITQTPDAVAQKLVRALRKRNKPHVVAGVINRLVLFGLRWLPRKVGVAIMGAISPFVMASLSDDATASG